jgi:glycosyltransferase involved in cell wall biosynthesis
MAKRSLLKLSGRLKNVIKTGVFVIFRLLMDIRGLIIQDWEVKVLVLHDPYRPIEYGSVGGEDNLANLEINVLSNLGHEVIDGRFHDDGINRKINQVRAQSLGSHPEVLELIRNSKPDVIHTHNLNQRSGYTWMNSCTVPIVSSIHNYRLFCPSSIAWRDGQICVECISKNALSALRHKCDGARGALNASRHLLFQRGYPQLETPSLFLMSSDLMVGVFKELIPDEKMKVLRNPSTSIKSSANLNRHGWIFAGRFVEEKGILDLIEMWPDSESLDIAGDGPLRSEIERKIQNRSSIRLIGTYPPGDNSILSNYEGMIFTSTWYEGSPLVIVDSFGAGTPVICTDISAAKEQVQISKAGVVIKGHLSEKGLLDAVRDIRKNFESYRENARVAIKNEFSIDNWGLKLESHLGSVAK